MKRFLSLLNALNINKLFNLFGLFNLFNIKNIFYVFSISALTLSLLPITSQAQIQRPFPEHALRGEMEFQQPPQILLDGKSEQLAPGTRIRGTNNLLVLSGDLVGQKLVVNYTRNMDGALGDIWIITESEATEKRPTAKQQNSTKKDVDKIHY